MRTVSYSGVIFCSLAMAMASGCGSSDYAPVSGVVTYNGEPVAEATVVFRPVDRAAGGLMSTGKTGSDGRYRLHTQGSERHDGVRPGAYKVTVSALEAQGGGSAGSFDSVALINAPPAKIESRLPEKYSNSDQSGLQFEVTSGSNVANFDLTD